MSFDSTSDTYVFEMYNHVYNHTKGKVPLGVLHNLYILNMLTIVRLLQNGYTDDDPYIMTRKLFGAELKIRKTIAELRESKSGTEI